MEQIYFSDNFFFLRNRIQVLRELLGLEINADLFNNQIMAEVRNIQGLLTEHEALLDKRSHLQGLAELAHQLFRIKQAFLQFLGDATYSKRAFFTDLLKAHGVEWEEIIQQIGQGNEKLMEGFRNHKDEDENQIISDAELELLFQSDQDGPGEI